MEETGEVAGGRENIRQRELEGQSQHVIPRFGGGIAALPKQAFCVGQVDVFPGVRPMAFKLCDDTWIQNSGPDSTNSSEITLTL